MPPLSDIHQIFIEPHESVLELHLVNLSTFGDYVCEAKNDFGVLRRTFQLIEGMKPPPPPHIHLRGVNSDTFDIDVGANSSSSHGLPKLMEITGYHFEIILLEDLSRTRPWDDAKIVYKPFTAGENVHACEMFE